MAWKTTRIEKSIRLISENYLEGSIWLTQITNLPHAINNIFFSPIHKSWDAIYGAIVAVSLSIETETAASLPFYLSIFQFRHFH